MAGRIDRGFVRIREGQVHFRASGDLRSGVRPLVMIHASPASALSLQPLMIALRQICNRPLYAPDTLGNGDSCKAQMDVPDISYYADAVGRQLDALGIHEVDVYGPQTGGSIALDLAIQQPERVRRVIIDGFALYSREDVADMLENYTPEILPDDVGSQFNWAWHFVRDGNFFFPWYRRDAEHQRAAGLPSPDDLHQTTVEVLKSITSYHHAYRASFRYRKRDHLSLVSRPVLLIYEERHPSFKYRAQAVAEVKDCTEGVLSDGSSISDKAKMIADWLDG